MSFFNKKEDVLHIELTPYGRHLLSLGKLMPDHYRFFDDDIMYNSNHIPAGGFSENQNDAHGRILNDTPKIKPNGNFKGVESDINKLNSDEIEGYEVGKDLRNYRKENNEIHINKLPYSMGSIKYDQIQTPALKIDMFNGEISDSTDKFLTGSNNHVINIPQIEIDVEWNYSVVETQNASLVSNINNIKSVYKTEEVGGQVVKIMPEMPIIRTKMEGAFDVKDSFYITAYMCEELDGEIVYNKLKRTPVGNYIKDDMLVLNEMELNNDFLSDGDINPDYLEHYLSIVTDRLIPNEDLCATVGELEVKNIYLDEKLDCEDYQGDDLTLNPYASRVTLDDLKGEC